MGKPIPVEDFLADPKKQIDEMAAAGFPYQLPGQQQAGQPVPPGQVQMLPNGQLVAVDPMSGQMYPVDQNGNPLQMTGPTGADMAAMQNAQLVQMTQSQMLAQQQAAAF